MPLVRMIISAKLPSELPEEAIVNTLYFNVSGSVDPPNYQSLVDDLWTVWTARAWTAQRVVTVRAYDMADAKPRPIKAQKSQISALSFSEPTGPKQVALCLSYYGDRNLPRQRGRLYIGPWDAPAQRPTTTQRNMLITLTGGLFNLGGVNVDWSVYSPTAGTNNAIKAGWVDDSWDIIRSRQLKPTNRITYTGNG